MSEIDFIQFMSCYLSLQTIILRLRSNINLRNHHFSREAKYPLNSFDPMFKGYCWTIPARVFQNEFHTPSMKGTSKKGYSSCKNKIRAPITLLKRKSCGILLNTSLFQIRMFISRKTPKLCRSCIPFFISGHFHSGLWHPANDEQVWCSTWSFNLVLGFLRALLASQLLTISLLHFITRRVITSLSGVKFD